MTPLERFAVNLYAQILVLTWLACVGATECELVDEDGDIGAGWRGWGQA